MKFRLFSILALALAVLPATARKTAPQTFPDGTPVSEWFLDQSVPTLESLGKVYSLSDYGIISSIDEVQTAAIQHVIDDAAKTGGVVYVPEGIFKSGALHFPQGTNLYLCKGAVLLGSGSILDYPVQMTRIEGQTCMYFPALINGDYLDGFVIAGEGIIDGNGSDYWRQFRVRRQWNPKCTNKDEMRPRLVHFEHCRNITISGVNLQNSPFWTCHLYKCSDVKLLNVRYYSPRYPIASASADGVDMDVCSNVLIRGCRFTVNDDAVCFKGGKGPWADKDTTNGPCENVLVENCVFDKTTGSCVTCGSESVHVRNVLIRNCDITGGAHVLLLKMRPDTPQHYEYITVDNVNGKVRGFLDFSRWRQFFDLQGREDIPKSYCDHIVMRNCTVECDHFIGGQRNDEEYEISGFTFENLQIKAANTEYPKDLIDSAEFVNVTVCP